MKRLTVLALALLLPACFGDSLPYPDIVTKEGYRVYFSDNGSSSLMDVGLAFDQAIEDACIYLYRYGLSEADVKRVAKAYLFTVIDHMRFATPYSPTGYASGQIMIGHAIQVALYSRIRDASGPPWTVVWWGGMWQSGIIPTALPALAHEILHSFFGPDAEHVPGYPPVLNPPITSLASASFDPSECVYVRRSGP